MDKLKSLIIFLRSAQHQSFSEAARQLNMSPSAVSRAVARLEEDLGIRLLQRTTRSVNFVLPQTPREIEWKFEREGLAISLPINSYLQFDYAEALLMAACQGAGIIQAPKYYSWGDLPVGNTL